MKRSHGEHDHRGGQNYGATYLPRHTARNGVFPYAPSSEDKLKRADLLEKMRQKASVVEGKYLPEKNLELEGLGNVELPSYKRKQEIVDAVTNNAVTIIVGPTGSGKSTQVPQFLLEAGFDQIAMTQPRIMAANGVGERLADELEMSLGPEARRLVAVQTSERFDHQEEARIFVRTDGLEQVMQLDKYLQRLPEEEAQVEASKIVLILDEVHESNLNQVGLLALVKNFVGHYEGMRVVVMSATAQTDKYTKYFSNDRDKLVPVVEIEGRPSELAWEERPDVDAIGMIKELVEASDKLENGDDILLFTSGVGEIEDLIKMGFSTGLNLEFTKLHSKMTSVDQNLSVASHPNSVRVIVSTDVAMTSLTFPNVKYVIDEGIVKNPELDEEGKEGIVTQICSQSEILQRGGRAGRVKPGVHILVRPHEDTGQPFVPFAKRAEYPVPPIYSTDLSRNVLRFACYGVNFGNLDLIDPVSSQSILQANDKLYNLGAIDEDDRVTGIGKSMDKFPVGTEYARMITEAMRPGVPLNVLVSTVAIASSYEAGGLRSFLKKYEKGEEPWHKVTGLVSDDPTLELKLFQAAGAMQDELQLKVLERQGYDVKNLMRARKAYRKCLTAVGLNPFQTTLSWPTSDEMAEIRHCIASGFVENIYVRSQSTQRDGEHRYNLASGSGLSRVISSRSVLDDGAKMLVGNPRFYMKKGRKWEKHDILENNHQVTQEDIDQLALRETLTNIGSVVRGGMVRVINERRAGSLLRGTETGVPRPGEVDRGTMLKAVLNNPGVFQSELKDIKRSLEQLQNLTKQNVEQLTQTRYEVLLLDAIRRTESTKLHEIDLTLGDIMREQGVALDLIVDPAFASDIRQAAVSNVEVNGESIALTYKAGVPIAQNASPPLIDGLPDRVSIPDGREVLFRVPKVSRRDGRLDRGYQDLPAHRAKQALARLRDFM